MAAGPDITVEVFGRTDVGLVREHNEDNFLVADLGRSERSLRPEARSYTLAATGALFVVCDGMGGAVAGEIASQMGVETIYEVMKDGAAEFDRDVFVRRIRAAVQEANRRIFAYAREDSSRSGMGTTCTAAGLVDRRLVLAQIGDSRGYVLRAGTLTQVTRDQSLANQLIEAGQMTPEEARDFEHANIILQALGVMERVEVALTEVELRRGDVLLLCSDGLSGPVPDPEITAILRESAEPIEACRRLTEAARNAGGPDNITVIIARFGGEALPEPTAADVVRYQPFDPGPGDGDQAGAPAAAVQTRTAQTVRIDGKLARGGTLPGFNVISMPAGAPEAATPGALPPAATAEPPPPAPPAAPAAAPAPAAVAAPPAGVFPSTPPPASPAPAPGPTLQPLPPAAYAPPATYPPPAAPAPMAPGPSIGGGPAPAYRASGETPLAPPRSIPLGAIIAGIIAVVLVVALLGGYAILRHRASVRAHAVDVTAPAVAPAVAPAAGSIPLTAPVPQLPSSAPASAPPAGSTAEDKT
jgi:protein phosphatase